MRRLLQVAVLSWCGLTIGCGAEAGSGPSEAPDTLRLQVRVHLLSSRLSPFEATFTDTQVRALVDRVNEVWAPANIEWEIESIVREPVEAEAALESALQGLEPFTADLLAAMTPRTQLLDGSWDVFLVHDLAVAGVPGIYFPSIPMTLASEVDPSGLADPGRILAHELAHSLSLVHVECTPAGNLMAAGCAGQNRTRLTSFQIDQARAQAEKGNPRTSAAGS